MRQKLSLITLGVESLHSSLDFYEKGLGWKRSAASMDEFVVFPLGGISIALYPKKELAADATVKYSEKPIEFAGLTISYNAKSEEEVNQVLSEVKKLGATIIKPAQKVFWGGYNGYFKDPNGFLFEVAYNPFWPLNEHGDIILPEK